MKMQITLKSPSRLSWETLAATERVPDNPGSPRCEFPIGTRSLWARAADGLGRLSGKPASLLLALLAVNALFLPYRGRYHDAILYGFQVINRVEQGRFADDLFFRYGSQDDKALFSRAVTPLAQVIGMPASFLLLYLAFNALFFLALQRLVQALIPYQLTSTLGLFTLAVLMVPLGGLGIFHVNENFLTPRLLATALALFGLERMLAGRPVRALIFLLAALVMHPLVGFGGLLVFIDWCLLRHVPHPYLTVLIGLSAMSALAILFVPSLGNRVFGPMDQAWREEVRCGHQHLFGSEWEYSDWLQVGFAFAVTLAAWRYLPRDPRFRDFMIALTAVTLFGIVGSVLASFLPYALLLQGQPFRSLWIVQLLHVPLALLLAKNWWTRDGWPGRSAAVLLLGCVGLGWPSLFDLLVAATFFLAALLMIRGIALAPRDPEWRWRCLAIGVVAAGLFQTAINFLALVIVRDRYAAVGELDDYLPPFPMLIAPLIGLGIGLALVLALGRLVGVGRTFRLAMLSACIVLQSWGFVMAHPLVATGRVRAHHADIRFINQFLSARRSAQAGPPTVYWPIGHLDYLWFDLGVNSYFFWYQLSGNVFNRETAVEGRRRADLVKLFEMDRLRMFPGSPRDIRKIERMFKVGLQTDPPRLEDLLRLCMDGRLDYLVARQAFPGWYAAANGMWFIYDCRAIRSRIQSRRTPIGE